MAISSEIINAAQNVQNAIGIPASVVLAQYYLESGDRPDKQGGGSTLAKEYNNYFGIKGEGTAGSVTMPTREQGANGLVTTTAKFAVYDSAADSFLAYSKTLTNRYNAPYLQGAVSVDDYVKGIDASPYATDAAYGSKLNSLIENYNLTQYDLAYKEFNAAGLDGYEVSNLGGSSTTTGLVQTGSGDTWDNIKAFIVDYVAEPLTTTTLLILVALAAAVFFMRAFPTAGVPNEVSSITSAAASPVKKVYKKVTKKKVTKKKKEKGAGNSDTAQSESDMA